MTRRFLMTTVAALAAGLGFAASGTYAHAAKADACCCGEECNCKDCTCSESCKDGCTCDGCDCCDKS